MIQADQPKIFKSGVIAVLSSVQDGNMKFGVDEDDVAVRERCRKLLSKNMIALQSSVLCQVTYDRDEYTHYVKVQSKDKGRGMIQGTEAITADGLATDDKGCALFLPLADCIGAVIYDPSRQPRLMLAHFGRHTIEQDGVGKSVIFMKHTYGSKPEDLRVWLGPSPNGNDYPLWQRDNQSMRDVVVADLIAAGVEPNNIEASIVDTITDQNYFSYSEYLKGNRPTTGRYAIAAKLR